MTTEGYKGYRGGGGAGGPSQNFGFSFFLSNLKFVATISAYFYFLALIQFLTLNIYLEVSFQHFLDFSEIVFEMLLKGTGGSQVKNFIFMVFTYLIALLMGNQKLFTELKQLQALLRNDALKLDPTCAFSGLSI